MEAHEIKNIAVIGTGTMGSGIAQAFALVRYNVWMQHRNDAGVEKGFNLIKANLAACKANGLIKNGEDQAALSRIKGVTSLEEINRVTKD